jgi:hypothetical protein
MAPELSRIAHNRPTGSGTRSKRGPERGRAIAEQPLKAWIRSAHVVGTPCSLAIRSSSAAVPALIARVFADELDRPVPPRGPQQSGYILLREPRADDARRIASHTIAYAGTSRATTLAAATTAPWPIVTPGNTSVE